MKKFICGPMATLSHQAFRMQTEKFGGCDEYFTEMINASTLLTMGPFEKFYLLDGPCPEKIVWQLTGGDCDKMAEAAKRLCEKDGIGIDLNMGCSAPQIYKSGAGVSWMLKPLWQSEALIKAVKKNMPSTKRLSVKCRLGGPDFTDESFFSFTDMLVENGVTCISLHARTSKEKYRGLPKYSYVEKLAGRYEKDKVAVYLNGNVCDFESGVFALKEAPDCDGLMIARQAAVCPWIFSELKCRFEAKEKNIPYEKNHAVNRKLLALDFINDIQLYQPQEFWKTRIQRFFFYYCQQFKFGHYFQSKMLNYKGIEDSIFQVNDYFEKEKDEEILFY